MSTPDAFGESPQRKPDAGQNPVGKDHVQLGLERKPMDIPSDFTAPPIDQIYEKINSGEYSEGHLGMDTLKHLKRKLKSEKGKEVYEKIENQWAQSLSYKMSLPEDERERGTRVGIFGLVQDALRNDLFENPDKEVEGALIDVRDKKLLSKIEGTNILSPIRAKVLEILRSDLNYNQKKNRISSLDIRYIQAQTTGLADWDDDFGGIVSAYKYSTSVYMDHVMVNRVFDKGDQPLERERRLLVWDPPEEVILLARKEVSQEEAQRRIREENFKKQEDEKKAQKTNTAPPLEPSRENINSADAERRRNEATATVQGIFESFDAQDQQASSNAAGGADNDTRVPPGGRYNTGDDAYIRYSEAVRLADANELEKLYNKAVRRMYQIPSMELQYPSFLSDFHLVRKFKESRGIEDDVSPQQSRELRSYIEEKRLGWTAVSKFTAAANFNMNSGPGEVFVVGSPVQAITAEEWNYMFDQKSFLDSTSVLYALTKGRKKGTVMNFRKELFRDDDNTEYASELKEKCPERMDKIQNFNDFEAMRDSVSYYLYKNKRQEYEAQGIDYETVRLHTAAAWNLLKTGYVPEFYDSKFTHPELKRLSPGVRQLKSTPVWEMLRPEDRSLKKAEGGFKWGAAVGEVRQRAKDWFFGLPNKFLSGIAISTSEDINRALPFTRKKLSEIGKPNLYPPHTIPNAFQAIKTSSGNAEKVLYENGLKLLKDPNTRADQVKKPTISGEGPFSSYQFDYVDYAQTITKAIKTFAGGNSDVAGSLGDAFNAIDLPPKYRRRIALWRSGLIKTNSFGRSVPVIRADLLGSLFLQATRDKYRFYRELHKNDPRFIFGSSEKWKKGL